MAEPTTNLQLWLINAIRDKKLKDIQIAMTNRSPALQMDFSRFKDDYLSTQTVATMVAEIFQNIFGSDFDIAKPTNEQNRLMPLIMIELARYNESPHSVLIKYINQLPPEDEPMLLDETRAAVGLAHKRARDISNTIPTTEPKVRMDLFGIDEQGNLTQEQLTFDSSVEQFNTLANQMVGREFKKKSDQLSGQLPSATFTNMDILSGLKSAGILPGNMPHDLRKKFANEVKNILTPYWEDLIIDAEQDAIFLDPKLFINEQLSNPTIKEGLEGVYEELTEEKMIMNPDGVLESVPAWQYDEIKSQYDAIRAEKTARRNTLQKAQDPARILHELKRLTGPPQPTYEEIEAGSIPQAMSPLQMQAAGILADKTPEEIDLWIKRNAFSIREGLDKLQKQQMAGGIKEVDTTELEEYLLDLLASGALTSDIPDPTRQGAQGETINVETGETLPMFFSGRPDLDALERKSIFTDPAINQLAAKHGEGSGPLERLIASTLKSKQYQDEFMLARQEGQTPYGTIQTQSPGMLSVLASQTFTPDPNALFEEEQGILEKLDADEQREIAQWKSRFTFLDVVDAEGKPRGFVDREGLNIEDFALPGKGAKQMTGPGGEIGIRPGSYGQYVDPAYEAGVAKIKQKYDLGRQYVSGGQQSLDPALMTQVQQNLGANMYQYFLGGLPSNYAGRKTKATVAAKFSPLAQLGAGPVPGVPGGLPQQAGVPAPMQSGAPNGAAWASTLQSIAKSYPSMNLGDYVSQTIGNIKQDFTDPNLYKTTKTIKAPTGPRLFGRV